MQKNNSKLRQLILDCYRLRNESGGLVGVLYDAVSAEGFSKISDIERYLDKIGIPDMLYLRSKTTNVEVDIYDYDLENYWINYNEDTIYISLQSKGVVGIIFCS